MGLSQVAETINVTAAALTLDTVSTALSNVVRPKQVQDLPLNGRDFTQDAAAGARRRGHVGERCTARAATTIQIDGADNNDAFQNVAAVNQGGVSGIAGTLLPIEAIDQFSVQSGGQAEMGRNAGSSVNLVIKSGTNDFHGSAFYFNRHEALSANSPVALPGMRRSGRSATTSTGFRSAARSFTARHFSSRPSRFRSSPPAIPFPRRRPPMPGSRARAQLLNQFNVPVNPVATRLLALWPAAAPARRSPRTS